jgi:pimeloyl-ACP methyl ester carboxylesterase
MSTLVPQYYDADPAWWNQLVDITVPTLYFAGTSDPDQLRNHSDAARRIPECEWARVPVGHHIHRDDPDGFLARLRRFLKQTQKIPTAGVQD